MNANSMCVQEGWEIGIFLHSIICRISFVCVNLRLKILNRVAGFVTQKQTKKKNFKSEDLEFLKWIIAVLFLLFIFFSPPSSIHKNLLWKKSYK